MPLMLPPVVSASSELVVTRTVVKLMVLLAVLLMPFGMAGAAAVPHVSTAATMPMGPDQGDDHGTKSGITECTMACAAALPAIASGTVELPVIDRAPAQSAAPERLDGLHPETATPPPRLS